MVIRVVLVCIFSFFSNLIGAQDILKEYIKTGLEENLTLHQKEFSYEKSVKALREARRLFVPDVTLDSRFTAVKGGRVDEFDLSETLDPIYTRINELSSQPDLGPAEPFEIPFLRPIEFETRFRLIQPLYQPELIYNKRIGVDLTGMRLAELDAYKRELIAEIKKAYYRYLIALEAIKIFDQAEVLLERNLKTSQSLVKNGKATNTVIYRIQAQMSDLAVQQASAEKNYALAASYFNFLLNRPFESPIEIDSGLQDTTLIGLRVEHETDHALSNREELKQLMFSKHISKKRINLNRSNYVPSLAAIIDYGFQITGSEFSKNNTFLIGSLSLQWKLSSFYKNSPVVQQSKIELKSLETQYHEAERNIELQVSEAYFTVLEAEKKIKAAQDKLTSAEKNYDLVQKQFGQNMISHIELVDAQTVLVRSQVEAVIAYYDYLTQLAEYERVTASYSLH